MSHDRNFEEADRALLRRAAMLKSIPDAALEAIVAAGGVRRLNKGQTVFAENQPCIGLLVVLSGAVKVYKLDNRGRELTLGLEGPGSSVAELPLFDGGNYPASAEAAEEGTALFVVPRQRFLDVMRTYPEVAVQALRGLSIRMRRMLQMLEAQSLHTVRTRVASYVLETSRGRDAFRLEETNEAIASHVGTVREVVSRTLRSLRESGAIDLRGRQVTVLDRTALARIADAEG